MLDDIPNAFVVNNQRMVLTTGLIKYVPNPEALIGIIAHEIGHIRKFHLTKRKQKMKSMQILDQVSTLAAITSSIISNNPEILLQTTMTSKSNILNYYSAYNQSQEREADLFAVQRLNDLNISTKGIVEFLRYLEKEFYKKGQSKDSFMFATHPNYDDRLNIISSFSNKNYSKLDDEFYERLSFIQSKLFGHTEKEIKILETYLSGDPLEYGKAIILAKQGMLLQSLKIINKLIKETQNYTYFLETKADILFNHGYTLEAKKFYEIVLSQNDNNIYIKKRLFHINYSILNLSNADEVNYIYEKYNDLIFNYSKDINFYHKWLNLLKILKKEDWILFVDALINIINNDRKKAILKLEKIKIISRNDKLIYNTNKLINQINNA